MVQDVRNAKEICGSVSYGLNKGERENIKFQRSLFAVKDIGMGDVFTMDNVRSIRPGQGMKPKYYKDVLGKAASRDIKYGEPIRPDMIL